VWRSASRGFKRPGFRRVAIDVQGTITLNGEVVTLSDLPTRLKQVAEKKRFDQLH